MEEENLNTNVRSQSKSNRTLWWVRTVVVAPAFLLGMIILLPNSQSDAYGYMGALFLFSIYCFLVMLIRPFTVKFFVDRDQWGAYILFCLVPFLLLTLYFLWGNLWYQAYPKIKLNWLDDAALLSIVLPYMSKYVRISLKSTFLIAVCVVTLLTAIHFPLSELHESNERELNERNGLNLES